MILSNTTITIPFIDSEERVSFIKQSKILGIYNDATVVLIVATKEYWSILKNKRIKLSKKDVSTMGLLEHPESPWL